MLLDTYAWIEYFLGTPKGQKVKDILDRQNCFTCALSLAEISEWIEKSTANRIQTLQTVKTQSTILHPTDAILEHAGIIKTKKRIKHPTIGLINSIIIATGQYHGLPIVTGDQHFQDEHSILL